MPRSGTTLVEQIISSHSKVIGADELRYVFQYGSALATDKNRINQTTVKQFRDEYLSELIAISGDKKFITDKMPHNFRFIPLICAALPEARIIHVKRNSAATCWSNYKQYFATRDLGYSYEIRDVVAYYFLYSDLMGLWQDLYRGRIYNLSYEKLTVDQDNETRNLLEYLQLDWEDACLFPQLNKRSVKTASKQQVREKVYQGSSEAWLKYKPFLDGAFNSLIDL